MNLLEMLTQQLSGDTLSQISQKIGADEVATGNAISAAVPLLVSALARNASQPEGAQLLHQAVANDHDAGILDDIAGFLGINPATGRGILKHVLGSRREAVENGLAQQTGLNTSAIGSLLETVAPIVMGMLAKTQQQQGLDANGLSSFLGEQQRAIKVSAPNLMGTLFDLLDANNDGNIMDDIGRIAGKLFGK